MIQIGSSKPPPRVNQYPMSNETLQGIELIIEDYKVQGLVIPYVCLCTIPNLLVKKPKGQRWRLV